VPLLKDSIRIVTVPPSPEKRLAFAIEKLRAERAALATTFNSLLQALNRLAPEQTHLMQLRAQAILHELDLMISELSRGKGGRGE
jgi:ElaB/YqjD/DUF883 family membrane-anchored ribosome-binding protein